MIERALIFPTWLFFRCLFCVLFYPAVAVGHVQAWLADGYRQTHEGREPMAPSYLKLALVLAVLLLIAVIVGAFVHPDPIRGYLPLS